MERIYTHARLLGDRHKSALILDDAGVVEMTVPMHDLGEIPSAAEVVNLKGDWVSLGGLDLQINGALGLPFPEVQPGDHDKLDKVGQLLWEQGVNGYCPTIVTTSVENFRRSLQILRDYQQTQPENTARILGLHLEGPFLTPKKRGAHPEQFLQPLSLDTVKNLLTNESDWDAVTIITLAPELDPTGDAVAYLRDRNVTVSLGHSLATADQANQAFEAGASMVTHAFNAMPSLHHREPGLLGAALTHDHVHCGFIADGQHICRTMLQLLLRSGGGTDDSDRGLFLVSDALSPLGLPDGTYPWDDRQITVTYGTARLPDGTLSGTTLPLLDGVKNLVDWDLCDTETAIALATVAPYTAINQPTEITGQPISRCLRWQQIRRSLNWTRFT
ncbi:MAG: N-acetylglucosamine-6-phosphate deacetylase [Cyanobacteria bacterium P01_F01_bin.153]